MMCLIPHKPFCQGYSWFYLLAAGNCLLSPLWFLSASTSLSAFWLLTHEYRTPAHSTPEIPRTKCPRCSTPLYDSQDGQCSPVSHGIMVTTLHSWSLPASVWSFIIQNAKMLKTHSPTYLSSLPLWWFRRCLTWRFAFCFGLWHGRCSFHCKSACRSSSGSAKTRKSLPEAKSAWVAWYRLACRGSLTNSMQTTTQLYRMLCKMSHHLGLRKHDVVQI